MADQPRIAPLPPDERDERTEALLASLRRDPDGGDLNIFATLARHPKLAKRWIDFGGVLLFGGSLDPRRRELLILRTAHNCASPYEWAQHARIGLACGVTPEELDRVRAPGRDGEWDDLDGALVRAADELHRDARIGDDTWAVLRAHLDDQQLIEVCMVVGQYHLVAFTLNSLGIQIEDDDRQTLAGLD